MKKISMSLAILIGILFLGLFSSIPILSLYESEYSAMNLEPSDGEIFIFTPENKTYTGQMSGYYPATFGFEDIREGEDPRRFNVVESGGSINVISEFDGHKKIVEFNDTSGSSSVFLEKNFTTQSEGTFEFYLGISDITQFAQFNVFDDSMTDSFAFSISASLFRYYDGALWQDTGHTAPVNNKFHHIRIDFRGNSGQPYAGLNANQWKVSIDGTEYGPYAFTSNNDPGIHRIYSGNSVNGYKFYLDAFSYSWDPDYNLGDNLNEGLLLSYDSNIEFDWQGCSLDGTSNRTILGNTTLPIPADGIHSIQVFGNDSFGTMHASDIKYFTTNLLGPEITINTPNPSELYGTTPPDFSLTISDPDINDTWYSLDDGITNIPFTGLTGTIDQIEWDKIGNGTVTIIFFANDSVNNIGQAEIAVRKDIIAPSITIIDPSSTEEFEFTPIYEISISEPNLDEIWYTIDDGVHNYTITETLGTINLVAWNGASSGPVTIRFYARDLAGNIGTSFVIVVKTSAQVQTPLGIPGYDIIALVGICCIISLLISIKNRGKMKI